MVVCPVIMLIFKLLTSGQSDKYVKNKYEEKYEAITVIFRSAACADHIFQTKHHLAKLSFYFSSTINPSGFLTDLFVVL